MKLLDLFCGAGGAAMGYSQAGFDEIVGVDLHPQPDYPFDFVQADALYVAAYWDFSDFDLIHASPPCQAYSALTSGTNASKYEQYPTHIEPVRELLDDWNEYAGGAAVPYIIENVAGAPIRKDITLCGEMFGLEVIRHRYFEIDGWEARQPAHVKHRGRVAGYRHGEWFDGPYFAVYGEGGGKGTVEQWQQAMGIDWTDNRKSIAEAIPPAYTRYLGSEFIEWNRIA